MLEADRLIAAHTMGQFKLTGFGAMDILRYNISNGNVADALFYNVDRSGNRQ